MHTTYIFENVDFTLFETKNLNLGNSGKIQGKSGEIRLEAFHSFSLVFPGVKYISLWGNLIPLISQVAPVKTDEN